MDKGVIVPLLGALQACVSVLLTMGYGAIAQRLRLIQKSSIDDIAGLGMKLLLPALIVVHLGEQLELGNAGNYGPVLGSLLLLPPCNASLPPYTVHAP